MPEASDEDRQWARDKFGDIDCGAVMKFLEDAGYRLSDGCVWTLPTGKHMPTDEENRAICFLIDEWDFDGWRRP